jgi:hypothetical protein
MINDCLRDDPFPEAEDSVKAYLENGYAALEAFRRQLRDSLSFSGTGEARRR